MNDAPRSNNRTFSLNRVVFWVMPVAALCCSILSCEAADWHGNDVTFSTGDLVGKGIMIAVLLAVWTILVWEDRRACRREQARAQSR